MVYISPWFQSIFVEKYIYLGFLYGHKSKQNNILINIFSPLKDKKFSISFKTRQKISKININFGFDITNEN